ncbi:hypothetical protein PA7_38450 [Pseudonocardia asaccharolytica DSM 44247 = NBRC 16224]|uniref:Uncharacterized protein n=1 Tax=Pseudonocardia asaccharolytica DSM 44247 = NBRC 16224 TaxID=1123024 RepID=A0A511DAM7_9PSEU|nr:hypothetical protein PA7_38450 [Pseudonocardia asaccharolytica DSM 44247 = NBRC 16224]
MEISEDHDLDSGVTLQQTLQVLGDLGGGRAVEPGEDQPRLAGDGAADQSGEAQVRGRRVGRDRVSDGDDVGAGGTARPGLPVVRNREASWPMTRRLASSGKGLARSSVGAPACRCTTGICRQNATCAATTAVIPRRRP